MRFESNAIPGMYATIQPVVDRHFPHYSAILTIKSDQKKEPIFMAMMRTFGDAVHYCKMYNYDVPVGIY